MNYQRKVPGGFILFLLVFLTFQVGCSGGTSGESSSSSPSDISSITEISSDSKSIAAAQGGTVAHDEVTATFPANILPTDAQMKASKVSISNSKQDSSLLDITKTYVISTTSSTQPLELADSATIEFKINPASFDPASIRLVVWNGYNWSEVPADYDRTRQVISSTVEMILPYGTRIYSSNPAKQSSTRLSVQKGRMTISEFVAVKVVGCTSTATNALSDAASSADRPIKIISTNFTVQYYQAADEDQAKAISEYMENAYSKIVVEMGFKKPGPTSKLGYKETWPVFLVEQGDAYARADDGNYIEVQPGTPRGDGLSHTCHHEFTHLVQYRTLKAAGNKHDDGLSWFDETMADAIGFYAQNKTLGASYSAADSYMGDFDMRLDSDEDSITNNDDYEYVHFPIISYILGQYGHAKFKNFFETFYYYNPGKENINMTTIDNAALKDLGKTISGREGLFWDFYKDYIISGIIFNKNKFNNLPNRVSGTPMEITEDNKEDQGATIVGIVSGATYQPKDFTMLRLSGQVVIFRYTGSSAASLTLSVSVKSSPEDFSGSIQLVSFKRVGGTLQLVGTEDVSDDDQITKDYAGFGTDIHEIYVLMANTDSQEDGYKVTVGATTTP